MGALAVGLWAPIGTVRADEPIIVQACGQDGCGRDRGCAHDGVCRAVTETKQKEKRVYTDTCEQFCLPRCGSLFGGGLFGHGGGDCDGGACHDGACHDGNCNGCKGPCTKKYLIVKIKHEEECVTRCVVDHAGCAAPHGCAAPAGNVQPIPAKPMPAPKQAAQVQILEYRALPTVNGK
jgi:hypothetical protein